MIKYKMIATSIEARAPKAKSQADKTKVDDKAKTK